MAEKNEKSTPSLNKLTGTIVFCMVDEPRDCFDKKKGKEWKCGVVVNEDTADEFEKIYPKQPAKKVKVSEFEEIYKCDVPEWAKGERNVFVITLRKNSKLANGNDVPDKYKPHVFEERVDSKGTITRTDITLTKLVANGSVGSISIDHWESDEFGNAARLKNILITEMIEYEKPEGSVYEAGDEFGVSETKTVKETVKPTKTDKKAKVATTEDNDPDGPF